MNNIDNLKSAIAKLDCGDEKGTAFLIDEDTAVTAAHCLGETLGEEQKKEIVLTFKNIPEKTELKVKAFISKGEYDLEPVSILKLEQKVETEYLKLAYCEIPLPREEKLLTYGYPAAKREEGYPVDLFINDQLGNNQPHDYDVTLLPDSKNKINDYSGMSGSPVLWNGYVVGILTAESVEAQNRGKQVIDINAISNRRALRIYENLGIVIEKIRGRDQSEFTERYNEVEMFSSVDHGVLCERKNYTEKNVVAQSAYEELKEDWALSVKVEIDSIYQIKLEGRCSEAWKRLLALTERLRESKTQNDRLLARLYYIRALWYLDDKGDCQSAQKYLQKVLDRCPEYDCRTYYARKFHLEGNVLKEKEVLMPIDTVSVLNTYLQICVQKSETRDALRAYGSNKSLKDHNTDYMMALVYITDHEYDLAEKYLDQALAFCDRSPLYIMMKGVVKFWKIVPLNISKEGGILPAMYVAELLPDARMIRKMDQITDYYKRALVLAKEAKNEEMCTQILGVWLNTLSVSSALRKAGKEVAEQLLEIDPFQYQAITYLYIIREDFSRFDTEKIKTAIEDSGKPIEYILAYIYVALGKQKKEQAYDCLKRYEYEFKRLGMTELWFELMIKAANTQEQQQFIREKIEKYGLEAITKMRLQGMLLEAMGEEEKLLSLTSDIYQQTKQEIDIINLVHCCEKFRRWEEAEKYSLEWRDKFSNPNAEISYIRSLAMQNRQKECLNEIYELQNSGKKEIITDEIRFLEAQALKLSGRMAEAISIAEELWKATNKQSVLFLLAECYFLNGSETDTIDILKSAIKKGIRTVPVYQMLAEHERYYSPRNAAGYAKKACMAAENAPAVLLWAMRFLYETGDSEAGNKIFVKLQNMDQTDFFHTVSFKEVRKLLEDAREREQKLYDMYRNAEIPYHVYIDSRNSASFVLMCMQRWKINQNRKKKIPVYMNFGGHFMSENTLAKYCGKDVMIDFSTILQIQHLELWDVLEQCWEHVYVSCDINRILAVEKRNCFHDQPDVVQKNNRMMERWKQQKLIYLPVPEKISVQPGVEPGDWIPYQTAKEKGLIWVEEHFISDLMEKPDVVSEEMRRAAVLPFEVLTALEKRGQIGTAFKSRYPKQNQEIRRNVVDRLVSYQGKLPILADRNFLTEIYQLDGVSIMTQSCDIYVFEDIFDEIESTQENVRIGQETIQILDNIQDEIACRKERGFIRLCEKHSDEAKKENNVYTEALLDEFHFAVKNNMAFLCDDRMVTVYSHFETAEIYNITDFIELLHEQEIITDEKYVNLITHMICEGYSYMLPPYAYMKILIFRIPDTKENIQNLPVELEQVCIYLQDITVSEEKMLNRITGGEAIPESMAFMYHMQRTFIELLKDIWQSSRSLGWKRRISTWLIINYSEFAYDSFFFDLQNRDNQRHRALELANFLFTGMNVSLDKNFQKNYYDWLFEWLALYLEAEEGLEEKTIDCFAEIIDGVYQDNSNKDYCEIGVGAYVQMATEDMPDHYAQKIRSHAKIRTLLEKFENNFILLDRQHLIETSEFFRWLEDSMRRGKNSPIQITYRKVDYEITWLADDVFIQKFSICWKNSKDQKKTVYYNVKGALLGCRDKLLRMKGFCAVRDYLDIENIKKIERMINQPEYDSDGVDYIVEEVQKNTAYWEHVIRIFAEERDLEIYTLEDIIPRDGAYFDGKAIDFPQVYYDDRIQWCKELIEKTRDPLLLLHLFDLGLENHMPEADQVFDELTAEKDRLWYQIYIELLYYSYRIMVSRKGYAGYDRNKVIAWSYYYTGRIVDIISVCERNGRLRGSLEDLLTMLENENSGYRRSSFWDESQKVSEPSELTYTRLIIKPVCKILNRYEGQRISKEKVKKWLDDVDQKMLVDLEVFKESVLCNQTHEEDAVSRILSGNLLDEIVALKVKYDIAEAGGRNKSARQLFMEGIKDKETLSENEFALLVILSQEAFDKEWIADIENAVRQFPYQETTDSDSRIALCICVILRRLRKEFVAEYLPVLKTWVKDQLTQEKISNEGDLMLIIEYISALENPDALVDGYIKFWQEILESGTAVKVSKETVEKLKRLTIVITMQQAKELRKVIATLNYAR